MLKAAEEKQSDSVERFLSRRKPVFQIFSNAANRRKQSPTTLDKDGKTEGPARSRTKRHNETLQAAMAIHGADEENIQPALNGLFSTLNSYCKKRELESYMYKNQKN